MIHPPPEEEKQDNNESKPSDPATGQKFKARSKRQMQPYKLAAAKQRAQPCERKEKVTKRSGTSQAATGGEC